MPLAYEDMGMKIKIKPIKINDKKYLLKELNMFSFLLIIY